MGILSLFKALAFCSPWTFLSVIVIFLNIGLKCGLSRILKFLVLP